MDTETFLLKRERLCNRLEDRRWHTLSAQHRLKQTFAGKAIPFWMRLALSAVIPRSWGGIWTKALVTGAPLVYGLLKGASHKVWEKDSPLSAVGRFLPFLKPFINRYN